MLTLYVAINLCVIMSKSLVSSTFTVHWWEVVCTTYCGFFTIRSEALTPEEVFKIFKVTFWIFCSLPTVHLGAI